MGTNDKSITSAKNMPIKRFILFGLPFLNEILVAVLKQSFAHQNEKPPVSLFMGTPSVFSKQQMNIFYIFYAKKSSLWHLLGNSHCRARTIRYLKFMIILQGYQLLKIVYHIVSAIVN
ncbi:MAG: hypothetical protein IJ278_01730 [Clostridia bacterium]|nr:hypothetical protein [Clostridia bacterium]